MTPVPSCSLRTFYALVVQNEFTFLTCQLCPRVVGFLGFKLCFDFVCDWRHDYLTVWPIPRGTFGTFQAHPLTIVLILGTLWLICCVFIANHSLHDCWVYLNGMCFSIQYGLVILSQTVSTVPLRLLWALQALRCIYEVTFWTFVAPRQSWWRVEVEPGE